MNKPDNSILYTVVDALLKDSFLLLSKGDLQIIYWKAGDLFLKNPCPGLKKSDSSTLITSTLDQLDVAWRLPVFEGVSFPFEEMREYLNDYGIVNNAVLTGDRFFWAGAGRVYRVYGKCSENIEQISGSARAYLWPTFALVKDHKETARDWVNIALKYGFTFTSLQTGAGRSAFIKRGIGDESLTKKQLMLAKSCLENLRDTLDRCNIKDGETDFVGATESRSEADAVLDSDKVRADLDSYDEKMLCNPNGGHWELWGQENLPTNMYARDPRLDVSDNGVVGIDFGTKSTVVVVQTDGSSITPMRIGTGELSKELSEKDYENPTIIELVSIDTFMICYREGWRPQTRWADLKVSHQANTDFFGSVVGSKCCSFFSDLKKWAGSASNRNIFLKDQDDELVTLKPYHQLGEEDFDPIEIYAYYLGLYINNMHNIKHGKDGIFMEYNLSFPVTYENDIRARIVESFKKGLKKSFPEAVAESEECMSRFTVNGNISEPAAYAVCALKEYGFKPEEHGGTVYYGIFDFGGGTTDFDFGKWTRPEPSRRRKKDFVITHFGAAGDKYLGGENLLELLAYDIFVKNIYIMRKESFTFTCPEQCKYAVGTETLIADTDEARYNTKRLMEALRPIWESREEESARQELDENGVIVVSLFHKNGDYDAAVKLTVSREDIDKLLHERISSGIKQFFNAFQVAFVNRLSAGEKIEKFHILLAGNSSKSPIVKELFAKEIEDWKAANRNKLIDEDIEKLFVLLPPIGSEEFKETKSALFPDQLPSSDAESLRPTGKTGVAYGLILSRKGGRIDVVNNNVDDGGETPFKYFLGYSYDDCFQALGADDAKSENVCKISIGKWYAFTEVESDENVIEVYYTDLPESTSRNMPIGKAKCERCRFKAGTEGMFYIRAKDPHTIEYAVASSEAEADSNVAGEVVLGR